MRRVLLLVLLVFLWGQGVIFAQGGERFPPNVDPDDVYDIASNLYCDVCQGVPLADCPSSQCRVWREEIAGLLSEGYTEQEIRERFADRYGEKVSGIPLDPEDRRFTYLIPIILIGLAAVAIAWQLFRWNKRETRALTVARSAGTLVENERPVPDNVDREYLGRVLKELEELK